MVLERRVSARIAHALDRESRSVTIADRGRSREIRLLHAERSVVV
jgi:hypothetical protein